MAGPLFSVHTEIEKKSIRKSMQIIRHGEVTLSERQGVSYLSITDLFEGLEPL